MSLKQLRSIRKFKVIPAKSRAAINSGYIKPIVENKPRILIDVECLPLNCYTFTAQSWNLLDLKNNMK